MMVKNIFSNIPKSLPEEHFENLISSENCRIARIISKGHTTKEGEWYDQKENEFVIVLKGNAELLFEGNNVVKMKEGDYINIPKHVKHRVEKTNNEKEMVWLTVFY